jgi:hypothetical protein
MPPSLAALTVPRQSAIWLIIAPLTGAVKSASFSLYTSFEWFIFKL